MGIKDKFLKVTIRKSFWKIISKAVLQYYNNIKWFKKCLVTRIFYFNLVMTQFSFFGKVKLLKWEMLSGRGISCHSTGRVSNWLSEMKNKVLKQSPRSRIVWVSGSYGETTLGYPREEPKRRLVTLPRGD